ncbi:hypothetical protein [Marinomonas pollencensis]|uniref:Uncharacterized protein n=1 Tax=Marinomonas pollencensis TaxID=491954 RepID=A0A3E0DPC5_9GAMM|nr:hypothetical protein [Marinomonas pollencensis]REG84807.1 hypothetical protein DFP81_1031 [Marinomonas pollencensis]
MNKINHKAIVLVFLLQILVGFLWYSAVPTALIDANQGMAKLPSIERIVGFVLASFVYLYFTAWLLVKVKPMSSFSMMILVVGVWLCVVLPNYLFISFYLQLDYSSAFYLLSYGAVCSFLAAVILPMWRASRSIFKS